VDCYSESGDHNSREAEVNDSKKQPVKEDCCISLDVPRLEDTTVSLETSSNVSVINCDMSSGNEKRGMKRQCEDRHDVTEIKKHAHEQTSGRLKKNPLPELPSVVKCWSHVLLMLVTFLNVRGCQNLLQVYLYVPVVKLTLRNAMPNFAKKKLITQLKRTDDNARKLDVTVVSKPTCESLNCMLSEDIIVVSGDSDEEFPSPQMSDDQKHSAELLKAEVRVAAHEGPVFHNVVDVDEIVLEDEDVEVDEDLFKRLLQQDCQLEPVSELCSQRLTVETRRRDMGLEEGTVREVRLPYIAEGKPYLSILDDSCNLKKQIADKSKGKLKAISEKEKMFAVAPKRDSLNAHAEVRREVTNKYTGIFLMEGAKSTDGVAQFSNVAETSVLSAAVQKLHLDLEKLPKEDGTKNSALQPKRCQSGSSSAPIRSVKTLPRILRISEWPSSSNSVTEPEVPSGATVETTSLDRFPISTVPILKTSVPTRNTKEKKKVCFKSGSEMLQIHVIPVARGSCLLPVAHKKDAPTPRKIVTQQLQQKDLDLADILYNLLCQDSKWMTVNHKCIHIIRIKLKCGHSTFPLYPFPLNSFRMVAIHLCCTESAVTAGCHSTALGLLFCCNQSDSLLFMRKHLEVFPCISVSRNMHVPYFSHL